MSETVKVGEDFLKALRDQAAKRDKLAQEMGAARFYFLQSERNYEMQIERSLKEQSAIGNLALKSAGLDPEAKTYTIDIITGEVKAT